MRLQLIFILVMFAIGALVGDRYGVPGLVTGLTDQAFEAIETNIGVSSERAEEDEEDAAEEVADANESDVAEAPAAAAPSTPAGDADNAGLRMNAAGLQIIKESEGLRLEAYSAGGRWFIGYGHNATAKAGMVITEAEAEALLREDVRASEDGVRSRVTAPINENQFSAMVSLAYNLGLGNFSKSAVLSNVNDRDYRAAADAFLNHNKAGGKVNEHLTHRREKERTLFLTPA